MYRHGDALPRWDGGRSFHPPEVPDLRPSGKSEGTFHVAVLLKKKGAAEAAPSRTGIDPACYAGVAAAHSAPVSTLANAAFLWYVTAALPGSHAQK